MRFESQISGNKLVTQVHSSCYYLAGLIINMIFYYLVGSVPTEFNIVWHYKGLVCVHTENDVITKLLT
jgi:hypothetical protein